MAITAKFVADFGSFYDAVRKADAQLIDLSQRAGGAEKALNRMVDNFSGRRLVQDAHLMSEAVERVGGVSRLTGTELQRVAAQAREASDKLKAMGQTVPPEIQKIINQTRGLTATQNAMIGTLKSVAGAFGIAFSAQQLVGFVKKTLDAASSIKDMADKLGVSTDAAQEFAFAAEQTGSSLETVERAIFEMNRGLSTGDKSTVKALRALGLEFKTIRSLEPAEAFKTIASAIQAVPDPMDQARLAMELFGKSGKDLLPAIKEGFVKIGEEAPKMSDATIKALERAQDQIDKFGRAATVVTGEVLASFEKIPNIFKNITKDTSSFLRFLNEMARLGPGAALLIESFRGQDIELKPERKPNAGGPTEQDIKEREEAAKKAAEAQRKWNEELRAFRNFIGEREIQDYAAAQKAAAEQIQQNVQLEFAMNRQYLQNAKDLGAYAGNVGLFTKQWVGFGQLAPGIVKNLTDSGRALKGGLGDFLKNGLSSLFGGASSISGGLKNMLGNIGKGIFQELGSMITAGISGLISGGISLIGKGLGKLFGRGEKGKVDDMRQAFIDQIGGWEGLNKAAQKAGITLERVLNARTVKEYEAAIDDLTEKMRFQDEAMATLRETAEKYGFTLEELGPKFAAAELDEKAQGLFKDFKVLTAAGIDMDVVLGKMAGSINQFVQDAVQMGVAVPSAMRPMIERMIELGLLTDKNGNVIESLEQAGVSFAMTMSEGFAALIDEVKKLTDAISRGLGLALDQVANQITNMPDVQIGGQVNLPDFSPDVPGFATGTEGRYVDFGRGTLAMLHGKEKITPIGEGEGGDSSAVIAAIERLSEAIARQSAEAPLRTQRLVREAVQTIPRLRR
jgi:hypothetical protein